MKILLGLGVLSIALNCFGAGAKPPPSPFPEVPIVRFYQVTPGLYRGGRPESQGFKALSDRNVQVDVDLENTHEDDEGSLAALHKIDFVSSPMSALNTPHDREVDRILDLMADPARGTLFIHCLEGKDRTGLMVGLFRVLKQGWTSARAYQEMKSIGFWPGYFPLVHYFKERTGGDLKDLEIFSSERNPL